VIIIGLITVTELREESLLPLRDFDLSDYTDAQLQKRLIGLLHISKRNPNDTLQKPSLHNPK